MTTYLHISDGPFGLLVAIDRVLEIADLGGQNAASGLRTWRNRNLRVVDLGARLGATKPRARQQIVLRDFTGKSEGDSESSEDAFALDVERVMDLLELDDQQLQPLGDISEAQSALVDAAWPQAGGACLLRLRTPFTWAHDGPAHPGHSNLPGATTP